MRYRYLLADVFTDRRFGGNPLAMFPDGRGLDTPTMQAVARELNLSETVFVLPPDDPAHTCRLRIFTPMLELPFAGHPTVGSAFLLAHAGVIPLDGTHTHIVFEEGVGPVPVRLTHAAHAPLFAQLTTARLPSFDARAPSREVLAALLSLQPEDLLSDAYPPQFVSCGVPYLIVALRDRDALRRARVDLARAPDLLDGAALPELYLFTWQADDPRADVSARMFAPGVGVAEDPATGSAAATLAGFLAQHATKSAAGTLQWRIEQGVDMGRPSLIEIEADRDAAAAITAIRVGGASVFIGEGELELPVNA